MISTNFPRLRPITATKAKAKYTTFKAKAKDLFWPLGQGLTSH